MKRPLVSTTSALALLMCGGGRLAAAPVAGVSDSLLFGTTDQTDVVREALSLGEAATPLIAGVVRLPSAVSDKPTIADPSAQSPSATFTYRPAVLVRGDSGPVGSTAPLSRRNPGNVSNLKGTVAASQGGIFSVPAGAILVNDTPAAAYNYIFRPTMALAAVVQPVDFSQIVPRIEPAESPSHSVFIGVRPAIPTEDADAAARRVSTLSATGSATPTVVLPIPRKVSALDAESAANLGYRMDAGLTTTIGFSTQHVRPTLLPRGAAATSTLGYTYVPRPIAPQPATLPPSIAVGVEEGAGRASFGTAGLALPPAAEAAQQFPADSFAIARPGRTPELVPVPIAIGNNLLEQAAAVRSLISAAETAESDSEYSLLGYVALVLAVLVPGGLAFLGFRMIRRAALRRLIGG